MGCTVGIWVKSVASLSKQAAEVFEFKHIVTVTVQVSEDLKYHVLVDAQVQFVDSEGEVSEGHCAHSPPIEAPVS